VYFGGENRHDVQISWVSWAVARGVAVSVRCRRRQGIQSVAERWWGVARVFVSAFLSNTMPKRWQRSWSLSGRKRAW
jgi:hypothetical protein